MLVRGFVDYRVDAVVKFGGSLLADDDAQHAVGGLVESAGQGKRLLVLPGGGPTDNAIEALDKSHKFAPDTHHRACARAQDQTGLMIADNAFGDMLKACETLEEARQALDAGKVAVVLPSRIIFDVDPFERTWEITSDAMAAWFAWLVGTKQLVILTNVDGVYTPGGTKYVGAPIPEVTATQLIEWGHTAVDACTAPFLLKQSITGWVIDGRKPERLARILNGQSTVGTKIIPE